ncbi:MAG TPA: glycoside hydrolase family 3 N-terminal domain-containing protein, partial [Candidatus Dormibacteraeota bacterium]
MHSLRRHLIALILVVALVAAVIHVVSDWRRGSVSIDLPTGTVVLTSPSPAASPTPAAPNDAASLQNDIGSILVVAQGGQTISPTLRSLVMKGRVGGVLLFASNFRSAAGLKVWTKQLRALASAACLTHPLLVMVDEEGGQVNQVKASFAGPSQLAVGAGGAANVRAQEKRVAAGLRLLGVGLDLAPVADVRTNA